MKKNASPIRTTTGGLATLALTLCLAGWSSATHAATLTVTTNGEIGSSDFLDRSECTATSGDRSCTTLRDAINSGQNGDTIVFASALNGQTITLTRYTNCLDKNDAKSATCYPLTPWPHVGDSTSPVYVSQFGKSAFFISGKSVTIDTTVNGATPNGVTITRGGSDNFRFFDVDGAAGSSLTLRGLTLLGGIAQGGSSGWGGGALGAGGAIFNRGQLVIERSTLSGNQAIGGQNVANRGLAGAGVGANAANDDVDGGGPNGGRGSVNGANGTDGGFGGGGGRSDNGGNGGNGGFGGGGGMAYVAAIGGFGGGGGGGGGDGANAYNGGFGGGGGGVGGGGGGMGGALFNNGGTIALTQVTLANNTARADGNSGGGSGFGGAVFNYNGSLVVTLSTLVGNTVAARPDVGQFAQALGGAVYSLGDSVSNCSTGGNVTCTKNGATLVMNGSIAYGSATRTADVVLDTRPPGIDSIQGTSTAQGVSNLIGSVGTLNSTSRSGLGSVTTDPQLGSLQNNGGPTFTMLPSAGSAAVIDALDSSIACPAMDQRGVPRPQGVACDIGAVEIPAWVLNVSVNGAGTVSAAPSSAASLGAVPIANCGATTGGQCQASFASTALAVLAATPSNGNAFAKWSGGACIDSTSKSCSVSMDASKSVTATFIPFTVSANNPVNGTYGTKYRANLTATHTGGIDAISYAQTSSTHPDLVYDPAQGTVSGPSTVPAGTYSISITATDSNGATSLPTSFSITIDKAAPNIVFNSNAPTDAKVGGSYTVLATPGASSSALTLEASGSCSIAGNTVAFNAAGPCTITAKQLGDTNYLDAVPATQTVTVAQAASGVNISSTPNPSQPGQAVTFTVSVALDTTKTAALKTKAAPAPTGTVSISDNGTVLGSAPLVNGVASVSTQLLTTAGSHSIVATYSGDANYPATQSAAFIQTVASAVATPVPTLNEWTLIGLTALLALFGASRMRRRSA